MNNTSLKSIAEQAGVSLSTVSRIINNSARVSDEKAARVRRIASGLGYRLSPKPSPKICFRTHNVALVYVGWSPMKLNEWGFMDGFENVFSENDLRLMLVQLPQDGSLPRVLANNDCDGILILADLNEVPNAVINKLKAFPCIQLIHGNTRQRFGDELFCDNHLIAQMAFDHLRHLGVKRPAFFNILPDHQACNEREMYFQFWANQAGLRATSFVANLAQAQTTPGQVLAEQLVENLVGMAKRPDGIFVPMDYQLPELYAALKAHGIEPMKDLQIISCDNCERFLVKTDPRPVTLDLRWRDLACYAARQLIWRIEHPESAPVRLIVKPEVIYP